MTTDTQAAEPSFDTPVVAGPLSPFVASRAGVTFARASFVAAWPAFVATTVRLSSVPCGQCSCRAAYAWTPSTLAGKVERSLSPRCSRRTGEARASSTAAAAIALTQGRAMTCLLYTSDAADEEDSVDLGGR